MNFRSIVVLASLLTLNSGFGASLGSVKVTGTNEANISFSLAKDAPLPTMTVDNNVVELTFTDVEMSDSAKQAPEQTAPHALIRRIGTFTVDKNTVKSRIVLNGSTDELKQRLHLNREGNLVRLMVDFPKGVNSTAQLLGEEDTPIASMATVSKPLAATPSSMQFALVVFVFILAGLATYFFARFLKTRGPIKKGSRKYLIEQLSYCAVGNKAGVSLLKIGNEFVLVGVSSQGVSMLSGLPKLQEQYAEEANLERNDFKVAVNEEYGRLKQFQNAPRVNT